MVDGINRYRLPNTPYFNGLDHMSLETVAGYARAERWAGLVGTNLTNTLLVPMVPIDEYSPYGAGLVERMREDPSTSRYLTGRWNRALVVSPATAILGLGSAAEVERGCLQAEAADPIMEGKAKFFLRTAAVRTDPICLRTSLSSSQQEMLRSIRDPRERAEQARIWRAEKFAEIVESMACNYGFINVEDAQGRDLPIIFSGLETLRGQCAVWSDDKQGTGVITASAQLSWALQTNRRLEDSRVVIFGAGAGAMGVYDELINHGVNSENILATDSGPHQDRTGRPYPLHEGRQDVDRDPFKVRMRHGISKNTTVEGFARGADILLNLGVVETLTRDPVWTVDLIRSLAKAPSCGFMTNPEPGILPHQLAEIRPDAFYSSGNNRLPNVVNNFTAFGYIGAGALMAMAGTVNAAMTLMAARGIFKVAQLGPEPETLSQLSPEQREGFGRHWLVPRPDDIRLIEAEAGAVAKAAIQSGVSTRYGREISPAALAAAYADIDEQVRVRKRFVEEGRREEEALGRRYFTTKFPTRYDPLTFPTRPAIYVSPEIHNERFEEIARNIGLTPDDCSDFLFIPTALTSVLRKLLENIHLTIQSKQLEIIYDISQISPELGLALAIKAWKLFQQTQKEETVFHDPQVFGVVLQIIPEARQTIVDSFQDLPEIPAMG